MPSHRKIDPVKHFDLLDRRPGQQMQVSLVEGRTVLLNLRIERATRNQFAWNQLVDVLVVIFNSLNAKEGKSEYQCQYRPII